MLGEALGASGAFQAVTLLSAFRSGRLPGVAGLEELDGGCPLPGLLRETAEVPAGAGRVGLVGLATAADRHGGAYALLLAAP
jgi:3-oxoacyl-(acyl-carrier-protein) synthase